MEPGQPSKSTTQDQTRSTGVRNHSRRKNKSVFLRGGVYRTEQTAARKADATSLAVDQYLIHF